MRTGTKGADRVLICGGNDLSFPQAVDMVRYGTGVVANVMYYGADPELQAAQETHEMGQIVTDGKVLEASQPVIDGILIPKFSMGRGMAGKTLKFSLSRGGRENLERVLREVQESGLHPGMFVTKEYKGLAHVEDALYDMKERKAIKILVGVG